MIDYCKSDVALLKAGWLTSTQAKCMTIASACNLYWRKHHLALNAIAVEPVRGWKGANVNQSLKALQWLYYQE